MVLETSFRNRFSQRRTPGTTNNQTDFTSRNSTEPHHEKNAANGRTSRTKINGNSILLFFALVVIGGFCLRSIEDQELVKSDTNKISQPKTVVELKAKVKEASKSEDESVDANLNEENAQKQNSGTNEFNRCDFRTYMSHRFYGLNKPSSEQPAFLVDHKQATYIHGKWPIVLPANDIDPFHKVCFDQSEWDNDAPDKWPFGDGQNPSIVSLASDPYDLSSTNEQHPPPRLDYSKNAEPLVKFFSGQENNLHVKDLFLGVACFGNAKCAWNMTESDKEEYKFSNRDINNKPIEQTMIFILNDRFQTIQQTTLVVEHDADWGTSRKKVKKKEKGKGMYDRTTQQMDDPRLFFYNGNAHVLYRNGPKFGYDKQVQNPIHFETKIISNRKQLVAFIKASETFTLCCGRNIALISEEFDANQSDLKALTWIDPVTIDTVDDKRRLLREEHESDHLTQQNALSIVHRNLREKQNTRKSNIHGTNGYMIPLHSTQELLGIAHFHRPENRHESDYALHGHHYTHAFFTIGKKSNSDSTNKNDRYELKRISDEFVFPTQSTSTLEGENLDADMIQFASGIDLIGSDSDGKLLISYGINDCEGAVFTMNMKKLQSMLIELDHVSEKEVIDIMKPFKS